MTTVLFADDWLTVLGGDCRESLITLPDESVQCVVTSPPYWGLRDYGTAAWSGGDPDCLHAKPSRQGKSGTNSSPAARMDGLVDYWRDVCGKCGATRIDRQLGLEPTPDEYVTNMVAVFREVRRVLRRDGTLWLNLGSSYYPSGRAGTYATIKPKDMVPTPWMVAMALQADGWYLRSDSHLAGSVPWAGSTRNRRSVWTIATRPYPGAHFATFPEALVEPCILAGCPEGGVVLDPFAGTGTVGVVAQRLSRRALLIDLNPEYLRQLMVRNASVPLGLVS